MTLDREGVGELVTIGVERGRRTRPDIKLGICGEHGGDPASIAFCEEVGLDYVSCSPFRVPIARLAAAQARAQRQVRQTRSIGAPGLDPAELPQLTTIGPIAAHSWLSWLWKRDGRGRFYPRFTRKPQSFRILA